MIVVDHGYKIWLKNGYRCPDLSTIVHFSLENLKVA